MKNVANKVEIISSAMIENSRQEILLVQSPKWRKKWTIPGGHIESGETINAAATREAEEEAGLRFAPLEVYHYGELINPTDFHRPAHFIYFHVYGKTENALKIDNIELIDYRWMEPDCALKMDLADGMERSIKCLIEYKKNKNGQ